MNDIEFIMHPEWWAKEKGPNHTLLLIENASDEANKAFDEYQRLLKYVDENEIDF
ncbi:hypothetical protein [Weissella cibaria]|uniref:hypothetical protein n=1 Tax=Weissella cibaria TaxID=137591 RepID=UPI001896B73F|nr:hypothetical protein [Weissella cibaria]